MTANFENVDNTGSEAKILVIRRDNIGDLVCTTPLFKALRRQLPDAHIAVLATRYNAPVLACNPGIDAIHFYVKSKHRVAGESAFKIHWDRMRMIYRLRQQRFDWILVPGGPQRSAVRLAHWVGGRKILLSGDADGMAHRHEVERTCHFLRDLGLDYETPAPVVCADPTETAGILARMDATWPQRPRRVVGIHISARKPSQRWPADRFRSLIQLLWREHGAGCILLWAPGKANDPVHPGDDEKAEAVQAHGLEAPMMPVATSSLPQLIAAISLCDCFICADGGAMHLAAGLGKPIVALFGDSDPERWRPWGVPQVVLHPTTRNVDAIAVEQVATAFDSLCRNGGESD